MKPFDLEAALRGEPVITRDGRPVKIAGYNEEATYDEKIVGWIQEYGSCSWGEDGTYHTSIRYSNKDLFMAPTERKEWVVVFTNPYGARYSSLFHNIDDAESDKAHRIDAGYRNISIHEITITE